MIQSPTLKSSFSPFAVSLFLLQFLLPWLALCSKRPCAVIDIQDIQLTKEYLDEFTLHLTGGSTDPHSVRLPADLAGEIFNAELWMKYTIGSVTVLGRVDKCALHVISELWSSSRIDYLSELWEELIKKNDCGTVVDFITRNVGEDFWDTEFGDFIAKLVGNNWDAMRPLLERVLAVLREREGKSLEYKCILRRLPIGFQYARISSGQVPFGEIDKVYLFDKPPHSLLREIFFQARCSPTPNPEIREYIATTVPWFRQFMPEDIPSNAKDTVVTRIVEPGHDVWVHIGSFMDAETLIFVWPLVCKTWNRSYSKILAEDIRIHEWFLRDLSYASWNRIHTIAPWNHFLDETSSAAYLGQCIMGGALGRVELDDGLSVEVRRYLHDAMRSEALIPRASKASTTYGSLMKLIEECYKFCPCVVPPLFKPSFLTDEEHERVIRYVVCEKKLAVKIGYQWIIDNIPRIYSILGEDQALIKEVIDLSTYDVRGALFIWIMIGQECGIAEETARLVFDKPGIFTEKFLRPVSIKPNEYYDFIAESGMLFEMLKIYQDEIGYGGALGHWSTYELGHLTISLILFLKDRPAKIEKIVASVTGRLPTLNGHILKQMKKLFGAKTMKILTDNSEYPLEDTEFVKEVLARCGLLDECVM